MVHTNPSHSLSHGGVSQLSAALTEPIIPFFCTCVLALTCRAQPNIMDDYDHPVFSKLQTIGKEITTKVKPKAVVVFSAHWQADGKNKIQVNTKEDTDLIYE